MAPNRLKKAKALTRDSRPSGQREDARSVKTRETMRKVAVDIKRKAQAYVRADSWKNQITNLGIAGKDKRLAGRFMTDRMVDLEAEDIWRGDDMAGRAVETVPNQIVRGGWEMLVQDNPNKNTSQEEQKRKARVDWLKSREGQRWWMNKVDALTASPEQKQALSEQIRADLASDVFPPPRAEKEKESSKEMAEAVDSFVDDIGLVEKVGQALKEERGYGGSALFPGIIDGVNDLTQPLNYNRIKSVDWVDTLTPLELVPYQWYSDPTEKDYGKPELYWMQRISIGNIGTTQRIPIHESRLITFPGLWVSRRQLREHWGWGDSVLVRMDEVLRDFQTGWQGAAVLLQEFSRLIISIKGLSESFASGDDDLLVKRAEAFAQGISIANAGIIDADEKAERQATPISGLPELLDRMCNRLAAAAHLPVTLLMGQAPAGLNATGASDIRAFYDNVGANRSRSLLPRLRKIYKMFLAARDGPTKGTIPDKWSLKFGPLYQLTETEEAQRRFSIAQADNIYIQAQVLLPEEVAISRFGGDTFGSEIQLDRGVRKSFDAKVEAEAEAQAAQMQAQAEAAVKAAEAGVPPTEAKPEGAGKPLFGKPAAGAPAKPALVAGKPVPSGKEEEPAAEEPVKREAGEKEPASAGNQKTKPEGKEEPAQPSKKETAPPKDNAAKVPAPEAPVGKDQQPTTKEAEERAKKPIGGKKADEGEVVDAWHETPREKTGTWARGPKFKRMPNGNLAAAAEHGTYHVSKGAVEGRHHVTYRPLDESKPTQVHEFVDGGEGAAVTAALEHHRTLTQDVERDEPEEVVDADPSVTPLPEAETSQE